MSMYDFSVEENNPLLNFYYEIHPLVEKYFSEYNNEDFISYKSIDDIFADQEMLESFKATAKGIFEDRKNPLKRMPE